MFTLCVCVSLLLLRRRAGLVQESGVVMQMQMARRAARCQCSHHDACRSHDDSLTSCHV